MSKVHQINISGGGVPKLAIDFAKVTARGIDGDGQAKPGIHGGIYKAVSLFSLEAIQSLAAEGHPIAPGSTGENITISGEVWEAITAGVILKIGREVKLKITSYATPCKTITACFKDGDVTRLHHRKNPRFSRVYAQVLVEGEIQQGDEVEIVD
jgi:MOSC domain-containing protein YiiM